jgi:hypothetical protein
VSSTFTTAARGYTSSASATRVDIHGFGRPLAGPALRGKKETGGRVRRWDALPHTCPPLSFSPLLPHHSMASTLSPFFPDSSKTASMMGLL